MFAPKKKVAGEFLEGIAPFLQGFNAFTDFHRSGQDALQQVVEDGVLPVVQRGKGVGLAGIGRRREGHVCLRKKGSP